MHKAIKIYPSPQGIHIEHSTPSEAQAAYQDSIQKGANVELQSDRLTILWKAPHQKQGA